MNGKTVLLIIDAQYDFCDPSGALFVPGAPEDVKRIARFVDRKRDELAHIIVTLDTHQVLDISHPAFWTDPQGNAPAPFTPIHPEDVLERRWVPVWKETPGAAVDPWRHAVEYLRQLEEQGEFGHFIWPEHCIAGSAGASLDPAVMKALRGWAHHAGRNYEVVVKGMNPFTEHFGVFRAQIPLPGAPETQLNRGLLEKLASFDEILICGEARSHCVAASIRQLGQNAPQLCTKTVVLSDCMSDVAGLGHLADAIYREARVQGVRFVPSEDIL